MNNISHHIVEAVKAAHENATPLRVVAGNTKHFLGRATQVERILNISENTGVISYQPIELVITVLGSTKLTEIAAVLAQHNQMLSFEPPVFNDQATIGGTLAANLSGPARPWSGSIRDMVLGVQLINGSGELLNFGGQVMKNVAGYDISRLQAGAMGGLGIMTQISLKVMPKPETETTLVKEIEQSLAVVLMNKLSGTAKPISAASWYKNKLHIRLSGAFNSVEQCAKQWSTEHGFVKADENPLFWCNLREYQHDFFQSSEPIWRFSIKPSAAVFELDSDTNTLIDWSGAQRWVKGGYDPEQLNALAVMAKGSVAKWRGGDRTSDVNFPMNTAMQQLQQRLKRSMDPKNILNPGRIYSWL